MKLDCSVDVCNLNLEISYMSVSSYVLSVSYLLFLQILFIYLLLV